MAKQVSKEIFRERKILLNMLKRFAKYVPVK